MKSSTLFSKRLTIRRIFILEYYIIFPLKCAVVLCSYYFLLTLEASDVNHYYFKQLNLYVVANIFFLLALVALAKRKFSPSAVRFTAFLLSLIDNLFLSFLIYFSGGLESELYMLYPGLIVRNAINFPEIKYQQTINIAFILFYIGALYSVKQSFVFVYNEIFLLRILMLFLVSICCWGIYFLVEKNRIRISENQERAIRSEKLQIAAKIASTVAHELKNPLAIISNALYLIKKNVYKDADKVVRHAEIIAQEIERADKIISDLLDYSGLSEGKIERVNVNHFLNQKISALVEDNKQSIDIQTNFDSLIPDLLIDTQQFDHLIDHILQNACEAVAVSDNQDKKISFATYLDTDDKLVIVCTDNGVGIDTDVLEQVFTPFYTTKKQHVGLGLSIVKQIVETYGGTIALSSEINCGVQIVIRFPLQTIVPEEIPIR
ncbi:MAG: GHKL domain-containing protein [bacterium]|nr:GHKL domain-containing protein [bacterium]